MPDQRIYFGRPGAVQEIWCPFTGVGSPRQRATTTFLTASGGARVQRTRGGNRTYTLDYGGLGDRAFRYLEAFDAGHQGPGPFVLLDPARRNLLSVNQSSGTSDSNTADGFAFSGGSGQAFSSSPLNGQGLPRSMLWTSTATAPSVAQMRLANPSPEWPGWPVIGRPYSFGFWVTGGGSDAAVDFTPSFDWLDAAGALISTTTGPTFTTSTTPQLVKIENANPPSTAVWCQPYMPATGATISSGTLLYFAKGQLNEGSTLDKDWSPGTGLLPVQLVSLGDVWAFLDPTFHKSPGLVLQEVGG